MSERIAVPLPKAYLLLNHGPTVLVSSTHGERRNVMAAAWSMPLDFSPSKVAVVIDKATLTRELRGQLGQAGRHWAQADAWSFDGVVSGVLTASAERSRTCTRWPSRSTRPSTAGSSTPSPA